MVYGSLSQLSKLPEALPQFLGKSYRYRIGRFIILIYKVDTVKLLNIYVLLTHRNKVAVFQAPAHGISFNFIKSVSKIVTPWRNLCSKEPKSLGFFYIFEQLLEQVVQKYPISEIAWLSCFPAKIFRRWCKRDFGPQQGSGDCKIKHTKNKFAV